MGTEAVWIPAAIAAAGAGASYYNTANTARKQDNALADQLRRQAKNQDLADQAVNQLITQRATSNASGEQQSTLDQYLQAARATQGNATAGLSQAGATSDAYKASGADAALGISDYSNKLSGLMSRIDAPQQQRQREAVQSAQLASNLGLLGGQARGDDFLAQLRLRGINRNPYVDWASGLLGGASSAIAGAGTGTGTTDWGAFGTNGSGWTGQVSAPQVWTGNSAFGRNMFGSR